MTAALLVSCLLTDGRCGWELVRKGEVGVAGGEEGGGACDQ